LLHPREVTQAERGARLVSLAEAERAHIISVLEAVRWNKKQAAQVLEISRGTLYRKIMEYGLQSEGI
jgi:Nif-specific regulatory protein